LGNSSCCDLLGSRARAQSPLNKKNIRNTALLRIFKVEIFSVVNNFLTGKDRKSRHKIKYFLNNSRKPC
jgi:hypothetical protein